MISNDDLDSFCGDLAETLRLYKKSEAEDLGAKAFRDFATYLDNKRETYEAEISGDGAKQFLESTCDAISGLNSSMEILAGRLRRLARLTDRYKKMESSGDLSEMDKNLGVLENSLNVVKEKINDVIKTAKNISKALARSSGGSSGKKGVPRQPQYFLPDSLAAGAGDLW